MSKDGKPDTKPDESTQHTNQYQASHVTVSQTHQSTAGDGRRGQEQTGGRGGGGARA